MQLCWSYGGDCMTGVQRIYQQLAADMRLGASMQSGPPTATSTAVTDSALVYRGQTGCPTARHVVQAGLPFVSHVS